MPAGRWLVPELWKDETVAILACGPSMCREVADSVVGRVRTIAINDAYKVAPGADVLYFCDLRWYRWHSKAVDEFAGRVVTLENYDLELPGLYHLHNYGRDGLSIDARDGIMTGRNSGYQAINLAILLGVRRILLLGYDMRFVDGESHFHGGHPVPTGKDIYSRALAPMFSQLPPLLTKLGVEVVNCTQGSALDVFPSAVVDDII